MPTPTSPAPVPAANPARHPAGLAWLCATEFWERFSFYGMQALLVLYMTRTLLLPGHREHVIGADLLAGIGAAYGARTPQALASAVFGVYTAAVYVTPIAGGWLADRVLGRTRSVALGAVLMAVGHFLMAFEPTFLVALGCLLAGTGALKGNISSQVGELYATGDRRRDDAYQLFMLVIQLSVIASPLVCGSLGERVGWHWGFGAAGVGMLVGLATYLAGRRALPPEPPRAARASRPPLQAPERRTLALLAALLPVLACTLVCSQEIFNAWLVWARGTYDLRVAGQEMPVTWLLSISSVIAALSIAASVAFWRAWGRRHPAPDELLKIALGTLLAAGAAGVLVATAALHGAHGPRAGLGWAVAFLVVNDLGFANIFPIGLALYTRVAPAGWSGLVVGVFFLHLTLCNLLVGKLGGLLERLPGVAFWGLHAAIVGGAAAVLLALRFSVGRSLGRADAPSPARPRAATA